MSEGKPMKPFKTFASAAIPIDIQNCDTDQIVPARFLRKSPFDADFDRALLHDLRFNADGSEKDFAFNRDGFRGGKIIVADLNWGCGSSREHAVEVLVANDIRAVIAPSMGDIHYNNCVKRGVLPIKLTVEDCDKLRKQLQDGPGAEIAVDLDSQTITGPDQATYSFEIDGFDKHRLLNGLDDIGLTMEYDGQIGMFADAYKARRSWLS
ncbi:MAG: 3-isopropylmalate dehydratase small subunit [Rhodospirillaceae bacterium]